VSLSGLPSLSAAGSAGGTRYGNGLSTVVGASGSSAERKSPNTSGPSAVPNLSIAFWSTIDEPSSSPPPLPKIPPTSDAVAMRSVTVNRRGLGSSSGSPLGVIAA
jgi:hypothetical protein